MGCRSALYAANTAAQAVALNGNINMGSVIRRYGCNVGMSSGNAVIAGPGYYDVDTNFTFQSGAAGTAVITLYKDGIAIPGATASAYSGAANVITSVSIPAVIKNACGCEQTITAVLTGAAGTINNAAIVVRKI